MGRIIRKKYTNRLGKLSKDIAAFSSGAFAAKLVTDPRDTIKTFKGAAATLTGGASIVKGLATSDEKRGFAKGLGQINLGLRTSTRAKLTGTRFAEQIDRAEKMAESSDPGTAERGAKKLAKIDRVVVASASVVTGGATNAIISVATAARNEYLIGKKDKAESMQSKEAEAEIKALEQELLMIQMGILPRKDQPPDAHALRGIR